MIENLALHEIQFDAMKRYLNRLDLVIDGVSHGRAVFYDEQNQKYYKIFHPQYCRRKYFEDAYKSGFFTPDIAPAFQGLIHDEDGIIGYIADAGQVYEDEEWRYENGKLPNLFWQNLISRMNDTKIIYYDAVPSNIIKMTSGQHSLIDLESVYPYEKLEQCLVECRSTLKPADLLSYLKIN